MNKLAELIRTLPEKDLLLLKQDFDEGNLSRIIEERFAELELPQKVCPVCNTPLADDAPYVLYFGTLVRKKARFDALDCLKFFIEEELADGTAKKEPLPKAKKAKKKGR